MQEQLESILAESVADAREREQNAFDQFSSPYQQAIVLYGAGNLGRKILRGLRANGVEPLAFADANAALWEKQVEGMTVYSPAEAVRRFGNSAVFVACIFHPDRQSGVQDIINSLTARGAARVTSFVVLFWKYPQQFLPYFYWDLPSNLLQQATSIRQGFEVLADDGSREDFANHLAMRAHADFACSPALSPLPAYFPLDLLTLSSDECFADCGAYDGDTIQEFLNQTGGEFRRIVAFEPDPHNYEALRRMIGTDPRTANRTVLHNAAVAACRGKLRFSATGRDNAAVSADGDLDVDCTTLDEALAGQSPTFIKMDIEGSEHAALSGGRAIIAAARPVLAVSIYHRPADLWSLPLFMHELEPESRLSLRMAWRDGLDLVCFAVPPSRIARIRT